MRDIGAMVIGAIIVVGGLFLLAALFGAVESLWGWILRSLPAPAHRRTTPPDESENPMSETTDPRGAIARRLAEAEAALSVAEGDAYCAHMLRVGLKMRMERLTEAAEQAQAESIEARDAAERFEAELPEDEAQLTWYTDAETTSFRAYRRRQRAGITPRYTETGVRIIDFHDDWGFQRAIMRVARRRAGSESSRRRSDALRALSQQLRTSAEALRIEYEEEATRELERLREIERTAYEHYEAVKAEAARVGITGPRSPDEEESAD